MTLSTQTTGESSALHLDRGSAHETVGLPRHRHYQGHQVFPGWSVQHAAGSDIANDRYIQLQRPVRSDDNVFELSYRTRQEDCRRCQGVGIEFDIRFDEHGAPVTVSEEKLLLQEVEKITFTIKGSNIFHKWYGTSVMTLVGEKMVPNADILKSQITQEITSALKQYKDVKTRQKRYQSVPPEEFLMNIVSVDVVQDPDNATGLVIDVQIENKAGQIGRVTDQIRLDTDSNEEFQLIG
jgi:phage baseplate assembly protein W